MNWFIVFGILIAFYLLFGKKKALGGNDSVENDNNYLQPIKTVLNVGQKWTLNKSYYLFGIVNNVPGQKEIVKIPYSIINPVEVEIANRRVWKTKQDINYLIYGFSRSYLKDFYIVWEGSDQLIYFNLSGADLSIM